MWDIVLQLHNYYEERAWLEKAQSQILHEVQMRMFCEYV